MANVRPGVEFSAFIPGTFIRFRWADAQAAAQRVSGEKSAAPAVLISALARLDLSAVMVALDHGLKNVGDGSPVNREWGAEDWPVEDVANLLIQALEKTFFALKPDAERSLTDQMVALEAAHLQSSAIAAGEAKKEADALAAAVSNEGESHV